MAPPDARLLKLFLDKQVGIIYRYGIGVQKPDDRTTGHGGTGAHLQRTSPWPPDNLVCQSLADSQGAVVTATIDHDKLVATLAHGLQLAKRQADAFRLVQGWNDDTDPNSSHCPEAAVYYHNNLTGLCRLKG